LTRYPVALPLGLLGLLGLLSQVGCHLGVRRSERDPVALGLVACQARLGSGVPARAGVDDSLQCLLDLSQEFPEDGRAHTRIARTLYERALAFPDPSVDDLASARSWALQCLALRPGVAARLQGSGGLITTRVLAVVPASDAECVAWAAISWAHWLHGRGVLGDAIDLEPVAALGKRAVELAPTLDRGRAFEAQGLGLAIVPVALGRDAAAAAGALGQARQQAPDRLMTAVETAELVYGPGGDTVAWERTLSAVVAAKGAGGGLDALEDAAAQARAQALLDQGPPPAETW